MVAMRVILIPTRLRFAAVVLFLCVPLAALETVIVTRAPWWRLPLRSIGVWSLSTFLICLPLAVWLMRGNRWAYRILQLFFGAWLFLSAWVAFRTRNPSLGFYTVFLVACFGGLSLWFRQELARSFFDPKKRWFQGLPQSVPGLVCRVTWGDRELDCKVARLDREGAFVVCPGVENFTGLKADHPSELTFRFRERTIACKALPMRALGGVRGAGFQFTSMAPDLKKELGDFIETLRGEGYAI